MIDVMVELQQPRTIIPRVHGQNLHMLVDHPYVYLRRDDVEQLAGIPPWSTGEALLLDDDQVVDIAGGEYYPLEVAIARARDESSDLAKALRFLDWVSTDLAQYITVEQLETAHRVPGFADAHTVAAAARLLDADPAISIGRKALFAHMAAIGWIERNGPTDDWIITHLPHSRDWLTLRAVKVGADRSRRTYLQIHVTPAGVDQLRRTLHALNPRPLPIPQHPALFD